MRKEIKKIDKIIKYQIHELRQTELRKILRRIIELEDLYSPLNISGKTLRINELKIQKEIKCRKINGKRFKTAGNSTNVQPRTQRGEGTLEHPIEI